MSHAYILLGITRLKLCTRVTGFRAIHNHTHVIMIVIHRQTPQCTHKTRRAPRCTIWAAPARPGRHASLGNGTGLARIARVMHKPQTRPKKRARRECSAQMFSEKFSENFSDFSKSPPRPFRARLVCISSKGEAGLLGKHTSHTPIPLFYKVLAF